MRLRSSQLVFLLLLACSLQVREERAIRWVASAVAGSPLSAISHAGSASTAKTEPVAAKIDDAEDLTAAEGAATRLPWSQPQPAASAASMAAHSSLRRA